MTVGQFAGDNNLLELDLRVWVFFFFVSVWHCMTLKAYFLYEEIVCGSARVICYFLHSECLKPLV